jgi:hypothetical protein
MPRVPLLFALLSGSVVLLGCVAAPAGGPLAGAAMGTATDEGAIQPTARPRLSPEVLPSLDIGGSVNADTLLLQRPKTGSVVLRALTPGERVQVLSSLSNGDGRWLSVGIDTLQGWVRAEYITQ